MRAVLLLVATSGCVLVSPTGSSPPPSSSSAGGAGPAATSPPVALPASAAIPWDCATETLPSPAGTCGFTEDPSLLATCTAGGWAALHAGVGHATVPLAIAAAAPGDRVVVCPGTWPGTIVVDRELALVAADSTPGATVIDGSVTGTGLSIEASATVVGLTVRNAGGGGYYAFGISSNAPDVTLECLTVEDNATGVWSTGAGFVVRTSTFSRNGGVGTYGGGALGLSDGALIEDSAFVDNFARYEGGAISATGDTTIRRSFFEGNDANYEGGALAWNGRDPSVLVIEDSAFVCNSGRSEGGALDIGSWGDDQATISGTTFAGNSSRSGVGAIEFGSWGSIDLVVTDSSFVGNVGDEVGAVSFGGWQEQGVVASFERTTFTDNVSRESAGGAIGVGSRVPHAKLTGSDLVFLRNDGNGVVLTSSSSFDCTACDLGAGPDDNTPHDAVSSAGNHDNLGPDFSL